MTGVYASTWRDIDTGVDPYYFQDDQTWADGALDEPGDPGAPITTRLEGPWGYPWIEGLEDPTCLVDDIPFTLDPQIDTPDVGNLPQLGAYEGAYRTLGPVRAWGHEPSGGLYGDQAIGRIMRFPANLPERGDSLGVWNTDYRDELANALYAGEQPWISDAAVTSDLLLWPNVSDRW